MNHKLKISVIFGVALASLTLANFALAQSTAPQPTNSDIIPGLNTAGWERAQQDRNYCLGEFKKGVYDYSNTILKTVYDSSTAYLLDLSWDQHCFVVLAGAPDNLAFSGPIRGVEDGTNWRPYAITTVETNIKLSTQGISKSALSQDAVRASNEEIEASVPSKVVGWILKFIFDVINSVLGGLTAFALGLMAYSIEQTIGVTVMPLFVTTGWTIVRDICNMFFILVLIAMALATILRVGEKYNYKQLLPKLIIMALLVNFSLVISVTIMNAVNFVVGIFAVNGSMKDNFAFVYGYIWQDVGSLPNGWMTGLAQSLSMTALTIVTFVVALALTGLFIIRLVGLYVLIILSPFAYVLNILPATASYAKLWWETFIKYLIWAPVAMFFISLDKWMVGNYAFVGGPGDSAFKYIVIMGFMVAAVLVAKKAGMVGGDMVIKGAQAAGLGISTYVARGKPLATVGNFAANRGWIKKEGPTNKFLGAWQKGAQKVESVPHAAKTIFKSSEKKYQHGVEDQSTRIQEKLGMLGDFDKDTIGQVSPEFVHELAQKGKFSANRVKNIYENGTRKQKEALLLAFKDGHFEVEEGDDEKTIAEKVIMRDTITDEDQKMLGIRYDHRDTAPAYKSRLKVRQTGSLGPNEVWGPNIENDGTRFKNRQAHVPRGNRPGPGGGPSGGGGGTGTGAGGGGGTAGAAGAAGAAGVPGAGGPGQPGTPGPAGATGAAGAAGTAGAAGGAGAGPTGAAGATGPTGATGAAAAPGAPTGGGGAGGGPGGGPGGPPGGTGVPRPRGPSPSPTF